MPRKAHVRDLGGTDRIRALIESDDLATASEAGIVQLGVQVRERLTLTRTYYVNASAGSDSNDGLTSGAAFATIQKAVNTIMFNIDCNNNGPTIQLADGTYIETVTLVRGPLLGYHFINIVGNTGTPSNVIWEAGASGICLSCRDYGIAVVSGMKFRASGGGTTNGCIGLLASQWGNIDYSNVEFGAFPLGNHVMVQSGGGINPTGSYSISGGAAAHMYLFGPGHILTSGSITITVSAGLTFSSAFVYVPGPAGVVSIDPTLTFAGAGAGAGTTGMKFSVHPLSEIQLNGVTLPGATAGVRGIGYGAGDGGTVTQLTNKSTGVTLSKLTGEITMNNAALNAATIVSFALTNTLIVATDHVITTHVSGGTVGAYTVTAVAGGGSATVTVRNATAGNLSEAIVLKFTLLKSATS